MLHIEGGKTMSVLIFTMLGATGAGVGLAAALAGYAQRNWTRRTADATA